MASQNKLSKAHRLDSLEDHRKTYTFNQYFIFESVVSIIFRLQVYIHYRKFGKQENGKEKIKPIILSFCHPEIAFKKMDMYTTDIFLM